MIFIPTMIKVGTDMSGKGITTTNSTELSWADYSAKEQGKIYKKAVKETNKIQKEMVDKYEKSLHLSTKEINQIKFGGGGA